MEKIFTVTEFNEFISIYLSQAGEMVVEGEISKINVSQSKWVFAVIKDEDSSLEIFAPVFNIKNINELEEGMKVKVTGIPRLYTKTARFSLTASSIEPFGEGSLKQAFDKLRKQLESEGLFNEDRKRLINPLPERIGIITAINSEGYHDFIKVLNARMGGIKIFVYNVAVQGREAVPSIIKAFKFFNSKMKNLDALVLVRGGGSLEDLASFNSEELARSIFASCIPVVVGVGHERDISLADLVADLRASTPSNAAELIVKDRIDVLRQVDSLAQDIQLFVQRNFDNKKVLADSSIKSLQNILFFRVYSVTSKIDSMVDLSFKTIKYKITFLQEKVENFERLFKNLDYKNVLKKGFSITYHKGKILKSSSEIKIGDKINTMLFDGEIESII